MPVDRLLKNSLSSNVKLWLMTNGLSNRLTPHLVDWVVGKALLDDREVILEFLYEFIPLVPGKLTPIFIFSEVYIKSKNAPKATNF